MSSIASIVSRGRLLRFASAIVASTESGQHLLKIDGYSRTRDDIPTGSDIKSGSFRVGGHSWHIRYFPNGVNSSWSDYISIYLQLDYNVPQGVRATFTFSLLDHWGKPVPHHTFNNGEVHIFRDIGRGTAAFIRREELENSEHLREDCFTIRCDVTVTKKTETKDIEYGDVGVTPQPPAVVVPPSDLHRHLGDLLTTGEIADLTFEVDGKTFNAHRCVLAARSPVFHAELLRGLTNNESTPPTDGSDVVVRIEDMEAQDFQALLHYIYTDTLPEMKGDAVAMLPDLVAAANRYKMERLRLLCEEKLCGFVNVRTAAVFLTFAGEHHCHGLKEACLRYLVDTTSLREVVKTNGLKHLSEKCPSVLTDLISKLLARYSGISV